ncbi:hypothetical protein [Brevundimonas sp. A19_0]|uniref:hypothetical protein n=1 Tax=Brevundimonas sp. A19_0 TaxID=2821087 RepID=UPI001ADB7152|nr:hypothetical protein [Brevundimonas sp. A19_0]MBO9501637.1 hypothetical protein [Brevundimonas sp. A19_0]
MTIRDEVDRAILGYHGDDLQAVTIGYDHWEDFCSEAGLTPTPVGGSGADLEVVYQGISVRPGLSPDKIQLITGF